MTRQSRPVGGLPIPRPDGSLCVEFFGLPGSGKTTIAQEVHAILSQTYPALVFAPRLVHDGAGAAVRGAAKLRLIVTGLPYGQAGLGALGRVWAVRQPGLRDKVRATLSFAVASSLYAHLARRGLGAVLDQGMMQALWSIQLRAPHGGAGALVARMTRDAAHSARIHVLVETPVAVCARRLGSRASRHSRMQGPGVADDDRAWITADHLRRALVRDLLAAYRTEGVRPKIIVVDGTADPVRSALQIVAGLSQPAPASIDVWPAPAPDPTRGAGTAASLDRPGHRPVGTASETDTILGQWVGQW